MYILEKLDQLYVIQVERFIHGSIYTKKQTKKKTLMKSRHSYEVQQLSLDKLKITRANPRILQQNFSSTTPDISDLLF